MLRFLSADWLGALDAALRANRDLAGRFAANPIAIAQEVTIDRDDGVGVDDAPDARVRYVIVLDGAGGRVETGPTTTPADVTFVCDHDTAAGLARGTTNAQRALTSGRLKVRGEIDRLAAASGALAGLGDVLGELRADTEY